jgi:uroporphyrinogen decarboxylase
MGLDVVMEEKKGPVFKTSLKTIDDIKNLRFPHQDELDYVYNAIYFTRKELEGRVPLIGFCGSPWTLFTYMTEGGSTKMYSEVKKWIFKYP